MPQFKKFAISSLICIIGFMFASPISANTVFFDDFMGDTLSSSYDSYVNFGSIVVNDSQLTLSAPRGATFPNVHLNYTMPADNYSVEVRYRFDNLSKYGVGVIMGDTRLNNGVAAGLPDLIFHNWGDGYSGYEYRILDSNGEVLRHMFNTTLTDWHVAKYIRSMGINDYYLDDNLLGSTLTDRKVTNITLGNTHNLGIHHDYWTSLFVDYIRIETLNPPTQVFSPYYSQKDVAWKDEPYDNASVWAGQDKNSIERWGCALSTASMILGKYDIKSPTGQASSPLVLNQWLKGQPDGYVGNGLVNWLAVSRYSKLSANAGQAPHSLEYTREPYSAATVSVQVAANKYPIVNVGGHFVLIHGQDHTNWIVADPNKSASELLATNSAIAKTNVFAPSNTDLSYMLFVGQDDAHFAMDGIESDTELLVDDVGGTTTGVRMATVAKPRAATYALQVTGTGSWTSYLYDEDGEVTKNEWVLREGVNEYTINYDPDPAQKRIIDAQDDVAPERPTLLAPADASYLNIRSVLSQWGAVDDASLPVTYRLQVIGGGSVVYEGATAELSLATNDLADGSYILQVMACDSKDNCSEWSQPRSITIDTVAPELVLVTPPSGWYNTQQVVSFEFADENLPSDYAYPSCQISKQGKNLTCKAKVNVCDLAGNCNTTTVTSNKLSIDWTAPKVSAFLWRLPWWVKGKYQPIQVLVMSGKDNYQLDLLEYKLNTKTTWSKYSGYVLLTDPAAKYVSYRGSDKAGNTSRESKIVVNIMTQWLPLWRDNL